MYLCLSSFTDMIDTFLSFESPLNTRNLEIIRNISKKVENTSHVWLVPKTMNLLKRLRAMNEVGRRILPRRQTPLFTEPQ